MSLQHDIYSLPGDLPFPDNDGAAEHLVGLALPSLALVTTEGGSVDLSAVDGIAVVFCYPRTGRPGQNPLVDDWDRIPGARGCTPQTCGYRDLFEAFKREGASVYGLSTQDPDYQREMAERLRLPFPILSDAELRLAEAIKLPTFSVAAQCLLKRLAWVAESGRIRHVFYPIFPPNESAAVVLRWLQNR